VALAWAAEATEKGVLSDQETIVPLRFGDAENMETALNHLGTGANDFYRLLGQGAGKAAIHYGGQDYACVLGQEMAGYATGEVFFVSQALGFRHSHLDSGGYSYDQKHEDQDLDQALDFLVKDEEGRVLLTSMVACLFAREVYKEPLLADCLKSLGYGTMAEQMGEMARRIQKLRWQTRLATGYDPTQVKIPQRFTEVTTWKGQVNQEFMEALRNKYAQFILELGKKEPEA
jgi:aldehyde:ferredoxin oxidoreductase